MKVNDLIYRSAEAFLCKQAVDGSFPPGHNGPYYDEELPLRNTAHVLILLLKAHELSGDQRFLDAALKALDYVVSGDRRPMGATFWMRRSPGKNFSNGLIGQAWAIEALAYAYAALSDAVLIELAEEVFFLHPFDSELGRWQVVNVDGSYGPVDMTFNHQLWFAAAASYLKSNSEIIARVIRFLDKLDVNLALYDNGLIIHALSGVNRRKVPLKRRLKMAARALFVGGRKLSYKDPVINKAIGYHAFNTYAFGMIRTNLPDHPFWKSATLGRMLSFLCDDTYRDGLEHFVDDPKHSDGKSLSCNRFGYPYNPPGIEVAYTIQTFREYFGQDYRALAHGWFDRQVQRAFDAKTGLMTRNTDDEATLSARVYEVVRIAP